ncbi:four-carbon acid sugar kinase family protein [Lacibacter sediminis]|uniref:Four-carbon acid sugar kinase family protein n=1 Tax=Lacibacter sediminis TaxID=2760713 RepID=A0A7G5XJQ4_9BACT|nr:four-carbon acid sugar kinase family protein [Lacibacter sediminis]QNA45707.1 four-carbon acid sugar kinase family protein [Lacibacter sediminis]
MNKKQNILLAFYGDDFTGSTDALEFITRAGAKAVLFIEPPTAEQLQQFPDIDVIGVAGKTRSLSPAQMKEILIPAFEQLKASGAKQVHYKVCSTFDSSPAVGSIGKAIDCGAEVFQNKLIPVIGGMPALGRYCLFGNLFARMGIGSSGKIYRLDRHPSMSKHPVTPADESDLRLHIGKQTTKKIGLIDITQLEQPVEQWNEGLIDEEVVLVDTMYESQLIKIGEWMDGLEEDKTLFSVGGSGVEAALGNYWNEKKILKPVTEWKQPGKAESLLVISGSCSPVTASQIEWAKENDFAELVLDAMRIVNEDAVDTVIGDHVATLLQQKKKVIVHTGAKKTENLSSEKLGTALGSIAKQAVMKSNVKRVVIAGGDTSSYAARAMEIDAVEMIAPLVSGAPLCKAYSTNEKVNGLEVNFKGGQVGADDYFGLF